MAKIYERKTKPEYSMVQVRVSPEERRRLRVISAELGISVQEFIRRLLKGPLEKSKNE